jgi:hypothetical protein
MWFDELAECLGISLYLTLTGMSAFLNISYTLIGQITLPSVSLY